MATYRHYREAVREYYRRNYPLAGEVRAIASLNPGGGGVSRLTHEPRVSDSCWFAMEHRPDEDHTIDKPEEYSFWRDYKRNFTPGAYPSDITLVNRPQNDYWLGNIQDVSEAARHLRSAKQLSLSLL